MARFKGALADLASLSRGLAQNFCIVSSSSARVSDRFWGSSLRRAMRRRHNEWYYCAQRVVVIISTFVDSSIVNFEMPAKTSSGQIQNPDLSQAVLLQFQPHCVE